MKKKIYKFVSVAVIAVAITAGFNHSKVNNEQDVNLNQIALACNVIPESTDDYCWKVEYTSPTSYNCEEGGVWSCYI